MAGARGTIDAEEDLWVFGYGSLVWRPAFPFVERRPASVRGFVRRFWQGSTDHRGVPSAPGRVVTLVPETAARHCWGLAYRVAPGERAAVLARLDQREKGGYDRHRLALEWGDAEGGARAAHALVYVATPENPNYLGPAALDAVVAQVLASRGPSGSNVEYVLRLADALGRLRPELGPKDDEVFAVAERVRGRASGASRSVGA